jgi:hypothetical protein
VSPSRRLGQVASAICDVFVLFSSPSAAEQAVVAYHCSPRDGWGLVVVLFARPRAVISPHLSVVLHLHVVSGYGLCCVCPARLCPPPFLLILSSSAARAASLFCVYASLSCYASPYCVCASRLVSVDRCSASARVTVLCGRIAVRFPSIAVLCLCVAVLCLRVTILCLRVAFDFCGSLFCVCALLFCVCASPLSVCASLFAVCACCSVSARHR